MNKHVLKGMCLSAFVLVQLVILIFSTGEAAARSPQLQVTGKITGEGDQPLSGVSVRVKGTNTGLSLPIPAITVLMQMVARRYLFLTWVTTIHQ